MKATIFTGWIYDHLLPHTAQVKVAHPVMLRAIVAAKKKNDRIDASKIADCLRCGFLPECHMAFTEILDRRRTLRYRHPFVRQLAQMKNRVSGLLMETSVTLNLKLADSQRVSPQSLQGGWRLAPDRRAIPGWPRAAAEPGMPCLSRGVTRPGFHG